jgi:hypothetical protein
MRTFIERAAKYVCAPVGNLLAMAMRSREALDEPPVELLVVASGQTPDQDDTSAREGARGCINAACPAQISRVLRAFLPAL